MTAFITFIGWFAFTILGAWTAASATVYVVDRLGGGSLENLPAAIAAGIIVAVAWTAFALWLSPLTISIR